MSISSHPNTPNPFENHSDVGSVSTPGTCVYDPEQQVYSLASAGANIWGDHDDFLFVWRRMRGDFILTMRAEFIGAGVNPHRKLGWMARTSLDTSSPEVSTGIHGDGLVILQYRRAQAGPTEEVRTALKGADVIQLERQGSIYIMSVANFGQPFTTVQVTDLDLGDDVYVGLSLLPRGGNRRKSDLPRCARRSAGQAGFRSRQRSLRQPAGDSGSPRAAAAGSFIARTASSKRPTGRATARP